MASSRHVFTYGNQRLYQPVACELRTTADGREPVQAGHAVRDGQTRVGDEVLTTHRIPNILHFCFGFAEDFGGRPFGLSHFACIASAVRTLKPSSAQLYYEFEPAGFWWEETRKLIDCVKIVVPREVFGRPLNHPAHRADVVRLEKLIESGGIYLDTDVFVHRSFEHLYDHSVVLGREGDSEHAKLCNAVILAEPKAPFLLRWLDEYRDFRGSGGPKHWNEHSVLRPAILADRHPDEITVLSNRAFFWPLFDDAGLRAIFEGSDEIVTPETLATHLWENKAWHRYLNHVTPHGVKQRSGNFYRWARPHVKGAPDHLGKATTMQKLGNTISHLRKVLEGLGYRVTNKLSRAGGWQ